jgi:hypothetical protein
MLEEIQRREFSESTRLAYPRILQDFARYFKGGHVDACSKCGDEAVSYNSCRNRHCPKCQANARDRWLEARAKELLSTRYVHVVFTLPRQLSPLTLQNKREA